MSYMNRNDLNAFAGLFAPRMAMQLGQGQIPIAPYPLWDAFGHGQRFGVEGLPFLQPGYGGARPGVFRDGQFRRWQRDVLYPQLQDAIYGPYRRAPHPRIRGRRPYGVRGLGGKPFGVVARPRQQPLHLLRWDRRGLPYHANDQLDFWDTDEFDDEWIDYDEDDLLEDMWHII